MIKIETTTEIMERKGITIIIVGKIGEKNGLRKIKSAFVENAGLIIGIIFGIML